MADEITQEETADTEPHGEIGHETDWKAEARKWEKRAKESNAKLSDFDSMAAKLAEAEERAAKAENEAADLKHEKDMSEWRSKAADEAGIPASIIRGSNIDEMREHAAAIKASVQMYPVVHDSGAPKRAPKTAEQEFSEFMKNFN